MIFMIVNSVLHQNTDQEWSSDSTLHTYAIPLLFLIDIDIQMTYSIDLIDIDIQLQMT